jgi:hypothetical protein
MFKKITLSVIALLFAFLSVSAQNLVLHEFSSYKTTGDSLFSCTHVLNPLKTGNANDSVFRYYHNGQWGNAQFKVKNSVDGRLIAKASVKVFAKKPGNILIGLFKEAGDAGQITWNEYAMKPQEINKWITVEFPINIAVPVNFIRLGINRNILPVTVVNDAGVTRVDSTDAGGNVVFMDSIKLVKTALLDSVILYKENLDRMPNYAGDYKGPLSEYNRTAVGQPARWNGGLAVTAIPDDTIRMCNNWGSMYHSFQFISNYPKAGTSIYVNNIDVAGFTKLRFMCDHWTQNAEIGTFTVEYKIDNAATWTSLTINTDNTKQAWATKVGRLPVDLKGSKLSLKITPINVSNDLRLDNFVVAGKALNTGIFDITYSNGKENNNLMYSNRIVLSKVPAQSISLYSVTGSLLKTVSNVSELSVNQYSKGIYIVRANYTDRSTSTIKIVL